MKKRNMLIAAYVLLAAVVLWVLLRPAKREEITLETARMVREDILQQNSFVDVDAFSEYDRQARMLSMIRRFDGLCRTAAERGCRVADLFMTPSREKLGRAKSVPADCYAE